MLTCLRGFYSITFYGSQAILRYHGVVARNNVHCVLSSVPEWNFFAIRQNTYLIEYFSDIPMLEHYNTCLPEYLELRCKTWYLKCLAAQTEGEIVPYLSQISGSRVYVALSNFRDFSINRIQEEFNVTDQMRYDASLVVLAVLLYIAKKELKKRV